MNAANIAEWIREQIGLKKGKPIPVHINFLCGFDGISLFLGIRYYQRKFPRQVNLGGYNIGNTDHAGGSYKDANRQLRHFYEPTSCTWYYQSSFRLLQ